MISTFDAFLRSWPFAPWLAATLIIPACFYARGWRQLWCRDADRWHTGRLVAFLVGLGAIYIALASPIEPFASLLVSVHMLQHLLLMMIAPPLIWLGWPLFPLLRGLPAPIRTYWVAPLRRWHPLRGAPIGRHFGVPSAAGWSGGLKPVLRETHDPTASHASLQ